MCLGKMKTRTTKQSFANRKILDIALTCTGNTYFIYNGTAVFSHEHAANMSVKPIDDTYDYDVGRLHVLHFHGKVTVPRFEILSF
jgi:hypothetical protein